MTLGGTKEELFASLHSSCQLGFIGFKSQLCSILQTTDPDPKIQKAMGNPTTHIFRLTSCPQLSKIK